MAKSTLTFLNDFQQRVEDAVKRIDLSQLEKVIDLLGEAKENEKNVFFFGNGGSHSIASHLACDLGKGAKSAKPGAKMFRCFSLDNEAWLTALANDGPAYFNDRKLPGTYNHGYDGSVVGQLENFINKGDLAFAISSSGNSQNIINGLLYAKHVGATTIAMVGFDGGEAARLADHVILVRTEPGEYGIVEGVHSVIHHMIYEHERSLL